MADQNDAPFEGDGGWFEVRPATAAEAARGMLPWVVYRPSSGFIATHRRGLPAAMQAARLENRLEAEQRRSLGTPPDVRPPQERAALQRTAETVRNSRYFATGEGTRPPYTLGCR